MKIRRFNEEIGVDKDIRSCSDYLEEAIEVCQDNGGNPENIRRAMDLAAMLDEGDINNIERRAPMEAGWYTETTIQQFKDLIDLMVQDEIENNNL